MSLKKYIYLFALILFGILLGLLLREAMLRIARPDLGNVVDNPFVYDRFRIHANPRNSSTMILHPDNREYHTVHYNSLGLP